MIAGDKARAAQLSLEVLNCGMFWWGIAVTKNHFQFTDPPALPSSPFALPTFQGSVGNLAPGKGHLSPSVCKRVCV